MKQLWLVLLVIMTLLAGSCAEPVVTHNPISYNVSTPSSTIEMTTTPVSTAPAITTTTATTAQNSVVYPSSIDQEYKIPMYIDEWVTADTTELYGHKKGDALSIVIHNCTGEQRTYIISVEAPPDKLTYSGRLNKCFFAAPPELINCVNLSTNRVALESGGIYRLPITINIPVELKNLIAFESYECRIIVSETPANITGQGIAVSFGVRLFLIPKD